MKNKIKIIWFIIKYGYEKFFQKIKMYAPSVAGSQKTKGKITIENINFISNDIVINIKIIRKEKFMTPNHFVKMTD